MSKIKPKPGQKIPNNNHSRKYLWFVCDCGNEKQIMWKNYKTHHTKSCGSCVRRTKYSRDRILDNKFGFLSIVDLPEKFNSKSRIKFKCDCGTIKEIVLKSVINGLTKSCGKCGLARPRGYSYVKPKEFTRDYWFNQDLPLKLIHSDFDKWSVSSAKKMVWLCPCGNKFKAPFGKVFSLHTRTCSKCDFVEKSSFVGGKWGKLTLIGRDLPQEFHKNTSSKFWFKCDCGNQSQHAFSHVVNGSTSTCGKCNIKSNEWWLSQQFGHLKVIGLPPESSTGSEKFALCKCSCGEQCEKRLCQLYSGRTKTCGYCLDHARHWWLNKQKSIIPDNCKYGFSLETLQNYFDGSYLKPLEPAPKRNCKIKFRCLLCNQEYRSNLGTIISSSVMSCGCVGHGSFSFGNIEIGRFIESLGVDCKYGKHEKIIDQYKVDVWIESHNLIIEYNGLRFHSDRRSDVVKYKRLSSNHDYMMIYEDEWKGNKKLFKKIIANKLGLLTPISVRPKNCNIELISNQSVKSFYEKYHYQGSCNNSYNIGIYYNSMLIAAMSLRKPSRQNAGDWEISRMACNFDYRIHGIWSFILKWISINNIISGNLITYSDNRLMSGNVYQKMGMVHISDVRPDYYWTDKRKRYHKSTLRKKGHERNSGKTEVELRESQGYKKLYDCGKKKWLIKI